MELLEYLAGYMGLIFIWNIIVTVILIIFLVCVPKYLGDIAKYLRGIYLNGIEDLPKYKNNT